jgi:hypothetical protein
MAKILRTLDATPDQLADIPGVRVLHRYPAFTIVEAADDAAAAAVARLGLSEDITSDYNLDAGGQQITTDMPRVNADGGIEQHPDYDSNDPLPPGSHHYIVQFVGPIQRAWTAGVAKTGARIVAPHQRFSVIAEATAKQAGAVSALSYVRWVGHLPYSARLTPNVLLDWKEPPRNAPRTRVLPETFTVQFFTPDQAARAKRAVGAAGFAVIEDGAQAGVLVVAPKAGVKGKLAVAIDALSRVHGVQRVARRTLPRISNDQAAVVMGTANSLGTAPPALGLSGQGEIIGICDTGLDNGDPATIHPDFTGRVRAIKSYPVSASMAKAVTNVGADDGPSDVDSGHGTHTSGSILSSGVSSTNLPGIAGPVRGLAYRAQLVMQAVEQFCKWKPGQAPQDGSPYALAGLPAVLTPLFQWSYSQGARIHSNSWGGGEPQTYNSYCRQIDKFVWDKPDFCILFAAGNDGNDNDGNGQIDLGSVTPPGTAKNCITVGASTNNRPNIKETNGDLWGPPAVPTGGLAAPGPDAMAPFSSRGPTHDNRIKPDVVAPGTYVLSTRSRKLGPKTWGYGRYGTSSLYMFDCGTSMATPLTAGAVGVLREYLRTRAGVASPSAALLKAALIVGAQPLIGFAPPPDNNQGFGRVNLDAVLAPLSPTKATFVDGPKLSTGQLNETVLRVVEADKPLRVVLAYSDYPGPALVNNLNLVVRGPDGSVTTGNTSLGGAKLDSANNVEVVTIPHAAAGDWRVQVVAANVVQGPQAFALAALAAT